MKDAKNILVGVLVLLSLLCLMPANRADACPQAFSFAFQSQFSTSSFNSGCGCNQGFTTLPAFVGFQSTPFVINNNIIRERVNVRQRAPRVRERSVTRTRIRG
jgi:hypothetical protein